MGKHWDEKAYIQGEQLSRVLPQKLGGRTWLLSTVFMAVECK